VFSRDLLQVEILNPTRSRRLFTIFNTHLKSQYCDFTEDPTTCAEHNNTLRTQQATTAARIIREQTRPDSRYLICGDFNDTPDSPTLQPLLADPHLNLVDALAHAIPDRPPPHDTPPAPDRPWSDRYKAPGQPASYQLLDQIWLSPTLAQHQTGAGIGRRTHLGGDGSDHDPVWTDLTL
jgi:endonuclease/exonuclease/phosphatase family metal-dependent hydrolase